MSDLADKYVYFEQVEESKSGSLMYDIIVRTDHEGRQAVIGTHVLRTKSDTENFVQRVLDLKTCIRAAIEEARNQ